MEAIDTSARLETATGLNRSAEMEAFAPASRTNARARGRVGNFHLFAAVAMLFLAPNAIFATALQPAPAALVLVGCAILGVLILRTPPAGAFLAAAVDWRAYAGCVAFGFALCLLGGGGHFFYTPSDWLIRDAVLKDLVTHGFNLVYRYQDQNYLLRAPLGLYMIPALIGRFSTLYAAHIAMLAQNTFFVSTAAYFVVSLAQVRKTPMLLLFFAFSGMDIVGVAVAEIVAFFRDGQLMSFAHIEWWLNYFTDFRLQYSSHLTQLFWVPNHMAPGWWFATLALLYVRREVDIAVLAGSFALMLLWSPLAMIGALPFLALFAIELGPKAWLTKRTMSAALGGLCIVPIALYLTMDAGAVPKDWLFKREHFLPLYALFLLLEIPQVAIIASRWSLVEPSERRLLVLAIGFLFAIPLYSLGPFNDFAMRSSIVPLFLVGYAFSRIATLTPRDNGPFATLIGVIVILSFATPMLELRDSLNPSYAISDCNMLTSWHKTYRAEMPTNYWARVEKTPAWLIVPGSAAPLTLEQRQCWPDHPLLDDEMK